MPAPRQCETAPVSRSSKFRVRSWKFEIDAVKMTLHRNEGTETPARVCQINEELEMRNEE